MSASAPDTVDAMMRGSFVVVQPREGHRAGMDSLVLASAVPTDASGLLVDLGAGSGTVAFGALTRAPALRAILVERDPDAAQRASSGLEHPANAHLTGRVEMQGVRVEDAAATLGDGGADYVVANPPFNDRALQPSAQPGRADAHGGEVETFAAWQHAALRLLRPGGTAAFICRAAWWPHAAFGRGFGDVRLLPIHARDHNPASRIVVTARKGRRTPPRILPPLVLHRPDGTFTSRASAIFDGERGLFE